MSWVLRNWIVLAVLLVALSLLGSYLQTNGDLVAAALLFGGAAIGAGLLAVVDGIQRVLGRSAFLGRGRGIGRLAAGFQVVLGLGVLASVVFGIV